MQHSIMGDSKVDINFIIKISSFENIRDLLISLNMISELCVNFKKLSLLQFLYAEKFIWRTFMFIIDNVIVISNPLVTVSFLYGDL